jgi:2-desacetyl-2-hydroxyethyl bacteriochlorophyllide A dehydrogenase
VLALAKTNTGKGLTLMEFGTPTPAFGEVLVKVAVAGICGSDVHIYEWSSGYEWMEPLMPLILGHEISGTVIEIGKGVTDFVLGDKVVCMPGAGCGSCELCRQGLVAVCAAKQQIGLHRNGAFAQYLAAPAVATIKLPQDADLTIAALAEPLAVSLRAVERAGDMLDRKVAVVGAGMIGLGVAHFVSAARATVWLFGTEQDQGKFAIAKSLGAEACINVDRTALDVACEKITGKKGFDVVFDCTGVSSLVPKCLDLTKIGGQVVALGIYPAPVQLNLRDMVRQEKNLVTSYGYTKGSFEKVLSSMRRSDCYRSLITHTFKLEQGLEAMELAAKRIAAKIILYP